MNQRIFGCVLALLSVTLSSAANAGYSGLFIFGDSLSDAGNNALLFDAIGAAQTPALPPGTLRTQVLPPTITNSFIPTYPYAVSNEYTNGQVWAQTFASSLGLPLAPSLLYPPLPLPASGGLDYAFGGARTSPPSPTPSLEDQASLFLSQYPAAPPDALYVVAGGGDNARDALPVIGPQIIGTCTNPDPNAFLACAIPIIKPTADAYASDIKTIVGELEEDGAKHIVVWNLPDIGLAPAILAEGPLVSNLATLVASVMNADLSNQIGDDPDVSLFNIFALVDEVVQDKGAFGVSLSNVTDACASTLACDPSTYLFWDGIHPTSAGDLIISKAMVAFVPEPATLTLLGVAVGLGWARRRKLN